MWRWVEEKSGTKTLLKDKLLKSKEFASHYAQKETFTNSILHLLPKSSQTQTTRKYTKYEKKRDQKNSFYPLVTNTIVDQPQTNPNEIRPQVNHSVHVDLMKSLIYKDNNSQTLTCTKSNAPVTPPCSNYKVNPIDAIFHSQVEDEPPEKLSDIQPYIYQHHDQYFTSHNNSIEYMSFLNMQHPCDTSDQHIPSSSIDQYIPNEAQMWNTPFIESNKPKLATKHIVPNRRNIGVSVIQYASRHHQGDSPRDSVVKGDFQEMEQEEEKLTGAGGRVSVLKNRWGRQRDSAALNTGIVMGFTLEEEFKVTDYLVRIEDYHNKRFHFLNRALGAMGSKYTQITLAHPLITKQGRNLPINTDIDKQLHSLSLDFTKTNMTQFYEEMTNLTTDVRKKILSCTYPALYVLFCSIVEANRNQDSWLAQMTRSLHFTKDIRAATEQLMPVLASLPPVSVYQRERFTWSLAQNPRQKNRFKRTIETVGELLKDDRRLQVLYRMLIMVTHIGSIIHLVCMDVQINIE